MSSPTVPYVLGGTQTEQQRLTAQAEGLEEPARWMLDRIGLKPGLRVVDVGCGPIGIMNLLSERVGADGTVIGVEREPRFFDMARAEQRRLGLSNVKLVNADALKTGLDKNSYDFVHERLVLINIPLDAQQTVLKEMLSLLKPGGTIAIQEFDFVSFACDPTIHRGISCSVPGVMHFTRPAEVICSSVALWLGCCDPRERKTSEFTRTPICRKSENISGRTSFRSSNRHVILCLAPAN